jgi:hypothetical protein
MRRLGIAAGALTMTSAAMMVVAPLALAESETPLRGILEGHVEASPCGPGKLCLTGTAEGVVSHLGRTTLSKAAQVQFGGSCAGGGAASTFTETITLVAANGDTLDLTGSGTACAAEGHAIGAAELTVSGGTGRFESAVGSVSETFDHDFSDSSEVIRLDGNVSSPGSKV